MNIKIHRHHVMDELSSSTSRARSLFALLCAERLRNCCWAYQASCGVGLDVFFKWSDFLFESLLNQATTPSSVLQSAIQELGAIVPAGGEPLSVQSQSGVICLLVAFELLAGGTRVTITDSLNAVIDALDNYVFFIQRRIMNITSSPSDYILLKHELDRQLSDVAFVKRHEQLEKSVLLEYRCENLQFAVPIAV